MSRLCSVKHGKWEIKRIFRDRSGKRQSPTGTAGGTAKVYVRAGKDRDSTMVGIGTSGHKKVLSLPGDAQLVYYYSVSKTA